MSTFRFSTFELAELKRCGATFTQLLVDHQRHLNQGLWTSSAKPWTELVLNWFHGAVCRDRVAVDTSAPCLGESDWSALSARLPPQAQARRQGTGEFLKLDLFATEGPEYSVPGGYWRAQYWQELIDAPSIRPLLALESEWKGNTPVDRYACVMHAVAKLAAVRADAKVLVFASNRTKNELDHAERWMSDVRKLAGKLLPQSPWLIIDVPWGNWSKHRPTFQVIARQST